jgi:hypothetical protein
MAKLVDIIEHKGGVKMKPRDYHKTFAANVTAKEAYDTIVNVADWWTNSFKGSAKNSGDTFGVTFGETKVTFKVVEAVPYKKLVWEVTDCYLHWLKNKTEWTGTKVIWDISEEENGTRVEMTHLGLVPGIECYKDCEAGWNQYVGESLPKLIAAGKGIIYEGSRG